MDVVVLGAGPAGLVAALRAADLGARTTLLARDAVGGMAADDGPVPVRTLAHAARLVREARQLSRYGITVSEPALDYARLLARVREVVGEVRGRAAFRRQLDAAGVILHEHGGPARFVDAHHVETASGLRVRGDRFVVCTGGVSRRLALPGAEFTATHSDAWSLAAVPPSMVVVGAGATGMQVASVFRAFGTRVALVQGAPRVLPSEDVDVSAAVETGFRARGIDVRFGTITRFERTPGRVRTVLAAGEPVDAALVVVAVGWTADTKTLGLDAAGVKADARGFVRVDAHLRTTAPHVYAAGDVTGRRMLVPPAMQDAFVAATNAVRGPTGRAAAGVCPVGSFTDPEYASVGLTEAAAREMRDVVTAVARFDEATRAIVDGCTEGFCKLVVARDTGELLGCHVVGDRAVEIVQAATIALAAGMSVDALARLPLSFPTYIGILGRAAAMAARERTRGRVRVPEPA